VSDPAKKALSPRNFLRVIFMETQLSRGRLEGNLFENNYQYARSLAAPQKSEGGR
jgi:hypothetical protein